jgi:hypothetical protein
LREENFVLKFAFLCLIVLGPSFAMATERHDTTLPAAEVPGIEMRLIETDSGTLAEVLSDRKLDNPRIEYICGEWSKCYEPVDENGKFLYRATRFYTPTPNTLFSVASDAPPFHLDKQTAAHEFKASYAFRHGSKERKEPVLLETIKPNALAAVESDPAGPDPVLRVINRWRAASHLPPVAYDPNMAAISQTNNAMGGVHAYTGNCRQTWAGTPDPESAVAMWINSSGHRNIILASNLVRGGSHCAGNGATFTGNP